MTALAIATAYRRSRSLRGLGRLERRAWARSLLTLNHGDRA